MQGIKDQSMEIRLEPHEGVATVSYEKVMNEEFLAAYRQALSFSNLELDRELRFRNVPIYQGEHMHELYTASRAPRPHLVLLHGYGGTALTFVRTFEHLKDHFQVHALDTFGVGLSSRGRWKDKMSLEETSSYYIDAIEEWRKAVGIESFVLAGHSFGGYIAALYYERYARRVDHLIFLSPAGSGKLSEETIQARAQKSRFFFCIAEKIFNINIRPSRIMSNFFLGNKFVERVLTGRLKLADEEKSAWREYLRHVANIDETSEGGFYTFFEWPLQPVRSIEEILKGMKLDIKVDFFFGDMDWMSQEGATRLAKDHPNIELHIVDSAGHQLIFDNPLQVTDKIKRCLQPKLQEQQ